MTTSISKISYKAHKKEVTYIKIKTEALSTFTILTIPSHFTNDIDRIRAVLDMSGPGFKPQSANS